MDPLITPAPEMRIMGKRNSNVNGTDTCGYLSGDIGIPSLSRGVSQDTKSDRVHDSFTFDLSSRIHMHKRTLDRTSLPGLLQFRQLRVELGRADLHHRILREY